jgi:hypothetical protein
LFSWLCLVYQSGEPNKDFPMIDDTAQDALTQNTAETAAPAAERDISDLPPAAQRALAEADERRAAHDAKIAAMPLELGGRDGLDPVRYGDYEKKGIAIDF